MKRRDAGGPEKQPAEAEAEKAAKAPRAEAEKTTAEPGAEATKAAKA